METYGTLRDVRASLHSARFRRENRSTPFRRDDAVPSFDPGDNLAALKSETPLHVQFDLLFTLKLGHDLTLEQLGSPPARGRDGRRFCGTLQTSMKPKGTSESRAAPKRYIEQTLDACKNRRCRREFQHRPLPGNHPTTRARISTTAARTASHGLETQIRCEDAASPTTSVEQRMLGECSDCEVKGDGRGGRGESLPIPPGVRNAVDR